MLKIIALLLELLIAPAWAQSPISAFPPGTFQSRAALDASAAVTPPAYTYINSVFSNASGAGISQSFALGSNPTCKAVVGVTLGNSPVGVTVSVSIGATSLTQDVVQNSVAAGEASYLFSGNLSSCTGSQTLTMTSTAGGFTDRTASLYVLTNTVSATVVQAAGYVRNTSVYTPSSPSISVVAGDLMFAMGGGNGSAITTCAGSSVAPNAVHSTGGTSTNDFVADWLIAATNASFATFCDASSSNATVAAIATYH